LVKLLVKSRPTTHGRVVRRYIVVSGGFPANIAGDLHEMGRMTDMELAGGRVATYSNAAHRIPKMAEVIAAELRAKIMSGEFKPGRLAVY
jgi:hypothetical protein